MDLSGSEEAAGPGLATLHPRLVIVLNEIRRIVPIDSSEFKVGRGKDIDLELLHPTISSHHSVIRFSGGKFTIEDAGSRNGTFVDRIQLRKGERSLLRPESYVRFAAAEAVFILDDPSAEEGGRSLQERAGEALVGERRITPLQLRLALEGAGDRGHIGERLLLETGLKVTDWIDAVRKASLPRRSASERLYLWCAVGALSLVILILLVVLLSG